MENAKRQVVLIVGSTGSLGEEIVKEFRRRSVPLRLLGRSWQSFEKAGFVMKQDIDLVVSENMTDETTIKEEWFADVALLVCVARPRAGSNEQERAAFVPFITNVSNMACRCQVPRMLLLGLPYIEKLALDYKLPIGDIWKQTEAAAQKRFLGEEVNNSRSLTIARIAEMSEAGFLSDFFGQRLGIWPCVWRMNPRMQFISARDFALAVAEFFANEDASPPEELLVGGPQVVTWKELGAMTSENMDNPLYFFTFPLWLLKGLVLLLHVCGTVFPLLRKIAAQLIFFSIPMASNTTSDKHETVGTDRVDEFLCKHTRSKSSNVKE